MKRLNKTESSIFVILCVLCFQKQYFSILYHKNIDVFFLLLLLLLFFHRTLFYTQLMFSNDINRFCDVTSSTLLRGVMAF